MSEKKAESDAEDARQNDFNHGYNAGKEAGKLLGHAQGAADYPETKASALTKISRSEDKTVSELSQSEIEVIKSMYAPKATESEFRVYMSVCRHRNLNPFKGEVHFIKYGGEMAIVVGIYGLLKIAERTGNYAGRTPYEWCGTDGDWKDVWTKDEHPFAARVGVYRKDSDIPIYGIAYWKECAKYYQPKDKGGKPIGEAKLVLMWESNSLRMLAKNAEAQAVREACPDVDGIYIAEEFGTTIEDLNREPGGFNQNQADAKAQAQSKYSAEETYPFGKYKGQNWCDLAPEFLDWVMANVKDKPDVTDRAQWEIDKRAGNLPKPPPENGDIQDAEFEDDNAPQNEEDARKALIASIRGSKDILDKERFGTIYKDAAEKHGFRNFGDPAASIEGLREMDGILTEAVNKQLEGGE